MQIYITDCDTARKTLARQKPPIDALLSIATEAHGLNSFPEKELHLLCSDVTKDWQGHIAPTVDQVTQAIEFGKNLEGTLLAHCAGGQSRSTGFVLAILASQDRTPVEAFDALDAIVKGTFEAGLRDEPDDYNPNMRIVMHLDNLLNCEGAFIDEYCRRFISFPLEDARTSFWMSVRDRECDEWTLPL